MTTEISFGNAMLAVEQGKTVQYRLEYAGIWINFIGDQPVKNYMGDNIKWRIKPEPVKYSVNVWLDKEAKTQGSCTLKEYLFGDSNMLWGRNKHGACNKHYRITVESVEE